MIDALLESWWLGPALWAALYISDNLLTVACARMYHGQDTIVFEGSYEITPFYQADVNAAASEPALLDRASGDSRLSDSCADTRR